MLNMLSPGFNAQHSIKPATVEHKLSIQEDGTGGLTKSSATEVTGSKHLIELEISHQSCHPKSNTSHS